MGELLVVAMAAALAFIVVRTARGSPSVDTSDPPVRSEPSGNYLFNIVGESHYQRALEEIAGGRSDEGAEHECEAVISPERNNPHDRNAVRVEIDGEIIGHLSRADAVRFRKRMSEAGLARRSVKCGALIVGGWDRGRGDVGSFGVKLDLSLGKRAKFTE